MSEWEEQRRKELRQGRNIVFGLLALVLWWFVASIGCGQLVCVPYVMFLYSLYAVPVVIYAGFADAFARSVAPRWSWLLFLALAVVGFAGLLAEIHLRRTPSPFGSWESAILSVRMILAPTAAVIALYVARNLWEPGRSSAGKA